MVKQAKFKDGQSVERNIFVRVACDGRVTSFQVKIKIPGAQTLIAERFDSLAEARSYRDSLRADMALEPYKDRVLRARVEAEKLKKVSHVLVRDALERYKTEVAPQRKSASTQIYMLDVLVELPIAKRPLVGIGVDALEDVMARLQLRKVSNSTIGKYLGLLSAVYKWARVAYRYPQLTNPVADLPPAARSTASKERDRRLFPGEEQYLRAALSQSRNNELLPVFTLALETGARMSELLKLRRQDVDLGQSLAWVRDTKNGQDRQLLLSPVSVDELRALLNAPLQHIDGRVFSLTKANLTKRWTETKQRARAAYVSECSASRQTPDARLFRDLRWHDLRHEAISRVAELGWSEVQLMVFSGHREPRMVMRYVQFRQRAALARLLPDRRTSSQVA
jgi:integrase